LENSELNEYIKTYLRFNSFANTEECFQAEINAQRMACKLQQKEVLKNPELIAGSPRLYQMLKQDGER